MNKLRVSKILAKDILSNKRKHLKNGFLKFNAIKIRSNGASGTIISFYGKNKKLAEMNTGGYLPTPSIYTFDLMDGEMKLYISQEDMI